MTQVTLKKVFSNVKPTKFGDKLSVGLKIEEATIVDINGQTITVGDKYLNAWFDKGFIFPHKEGEQVDLLITTRGEYIDFKLPGIGKPPAPDTSALVDRITKLEAAVFGPKTAPEPDIADPDDY